MTTFEIDLNDEVFDVKKAANFLCKSQRTVYDLLKTGKLKAAKSHGESGSWEILKSSCLEYVHNNYHNHPANGDNVDKSTEGFKQCQSNYGMGYGTAISFRQTENALGKALKQRTKGKRRSCTIS